ncbi:MAG: DNA glycosylase AlkZ-like family protein [Candidatus Limnocylindria bacterium]
MTDASVLTVTPQQARRFLVRRHLLDPPRSLPAKPESVLRVVERLGLLQFDPLEVPGARNHDLVLHARIRDYRHEWCDRWLYGPPEKRRLFEAYNKSLNILPLEELPYYRIAWDRSSAYHDANILAEQRDVATAILERIRSEGPLSTAAFTEYTASIDWWWAPTRVARAVLEALFTAGRLGISRRNGNRRYYDLVERLFPGDVLSRRVPREESQRHRLLSRFRAVGLVGPRPLGEVLYATGTKVERTALIAGLVEDGTRIRVEVDGLPGIRHALGEERAVLEAARRAGTRRHPGVSFLAPLDPLVWDRGHLRELFGFDYLWEVYVPAPKRRWGYYVLPILFGDRLVGRIEPRVERAAPETLRILGLSFEPNFEPLAEPGFIAAFAGALAAYRSFVGATRVIWPTESRLAAAVTAAMGPLSA